MAILVDELTNSSLWSDRAKKLERTCRHVPSITPASHRWPLAGDIGLSLPSKPLKKIARFRPSLTSAAPMRAIFSSTFACTRSVFSTPNNLSLCIQPQLNSLKISEETPIVVNEVSIHRKPTEVLHEPFGLPPKVSLLEYLIRADLLTSSQLDSIDRSTEVVNLASASGHALDIIGILPLPVRIANQTTRFELPTTNNDLTER